MYEGKVRRDMHTHNWINVNTFVCAQFLCFAPTMTFTMKAVHSIRGLLNKDAPWTRS